MIVIECGGDRVKIGWNRHIHTYTTRMAANRLLNTMCLCITLRFLINN